MQQMPERVGLATSRSLNKGMPDAKPLLRVNLTLAAKYTRSNFHMTGSPGTDHASVRQTTIYNDPCKVS
jgi:hypothetical protein